MTNPARPMIAPAAPSTTAEVSRRGASWLERLAALMLVGAGLFIIGWLWVRVAGEGIPFDTDEADHANAALDLYTALRAGGAGAVYEAFTRQSFYPPLHSLIVVPAYLLAGPTVAASRLPQVILLGLAVLFIAGLVYRVARAPGLPRTAPVAGALAAAWLTFACPILLFNSALCMIEPLGVVLVTLLLWSIHRLEGDGARLRWALVAGALTGAIVLTKYSFGVVLLPAVATMFLLWWWRGRITTGQLLTCGFTAAGLLGLWVLICDRAALWFFIVGHPSRAELWSWKNFTFYPRIFLRDYTAHGAMGLAALGVLVLGLRCGGRRLVMSAALLMIVWALLVLNLSTTKASRHILFILPALWVPAGLGVAIVAGWGRERFGVLAWGGLAGFAVLCALTTAALRAPRFEQQLTRRYEGKPGFVALQNFIFERSEVCAPLLVDGSTDSFSLEMLRWRSGVECGRGYSASAVDPWPPTAAKRRYARLRARSSDSLTARPELLGQSLPELAASGHYRWFVLIETPEIRRRIRQRGRPGRSELALAHLPHESRAADGWRVTVFDLSGAGR